MAFLFELIKGQDLAGQQVVPMLYAPLNALAVTDPDQPGILQMLRGDFPDGNLLVAIGGTSGSILLPDDVDDVAAVATLDRLPTVARLYALDEAAGEFDRLRTDDDDLEASTADEDAALLRVMTRARLYQNTDDAWQRQKGQGTATVAASAARTVTTTFGPFLNTNWRAWHVIIDVTVIGADTLTIDIEAQDPVTLAFYPLLTALAISTTGTTVLKIGQGFTPVANLTANNMIPYTTQVVATHSGADPITYSIASNYGV